MRKYQQKQILEFIKTLYEATAEIKRFLSRKDSNSVMQLLADCQEMAIQIGNYIEQLEGEGMQTISFLEEYCQLLYQANVEANNTGSDIKIAKPLQKQLIKIENSVKDELKPNKIEIVFLPYKASMWDSLESIWLASKDDPQCDAYVVAIPYYDRISGGAFGEMHYEGNQYPDYVPIVDWRTYNIEECHPDVVFTHNPYDEGNYVTSVHPDYYNKRLKELTDMLCYVPYFVVFDDVPEHFCVCAGTLYADKVFVQSEKIRQSYIKHFKAFEKANSYVGRFGKAENKFIASGSPKFDKVINSKPKDFTLPNEWRKLIEKPDGTMKPIVLYNTSVGAILQGNVQYIKKLRYVLNVFKARNDVVLWWRPHPLSDVTYESMRSQLLDEYKSIVAEYRQEGFGIYDDTADLHRAISYTSAYYGDNSSLVAMYAITGKPMLLQNLDTGNPPIFSFRVGEVGGDKLWMLPLNFNGLYSINIHTLDITFAGSFPGETLDSVHLYYGVSQLNGKVYFAPFNAKEMAMFDTSNNTFHKIPLPPPQKDMRLGNFKFITSITFGKYIFMLPCHFPAIVRYDSESGAFEQYTDWLLSYDRLDKVQDHITNTYFCGMAVVGNEFFSTFRGTNMVVAFNMETCISTIYEVGNKERRYASIDFDGECFWITPCIGDVIVRWNKKTGECKEYHTDAGNGDFLFTNPTYVEGFVYVLPYNGTKALRIDPKNERVEIAEGFQEICDKQDADCSEMKFISPINFYGKLYAIALKTSEIIQYDPATKKLKRRTAIVEERPQIDNAMRYGDFIESCLYTVLDYMNDIVARDKSDEIRLERSRTQTEDIVGNNMAGEKIYAMLKKQQRM